MKNNRFTFFMVLAILAGIFYPTQNVKAQFTLDNPVCSYDATMPPPLVTTNTRTGTYVDVYENTAVISGDDNYQTTYGHVYEFVNDAWVPVQSVSFPDPPNPLVGVSRAGHVAIGANNMVVCPSQYPDQTLKPKVYERDATGEFVLLGDIPTFRNGVEFFRSIIIDDIVIIQNIDYRPPAANNIFPTSYVDVFRRTVDAGTGAVSYVFDYNIYTGKLTEEITTYRSIDADEDHVLVNIDASNLRVYSKDASGRYTVPFSISTSNRTRPVISEGRMAVRNFGLNGSLYYEVNPDGTWSASNKWPANNILLAMDGNYAYGTSGSFGYLYEYDGSSWTRIEETKFSAGGSDWDLEGRHIHLGFKYAVLNCENVSACSSITSPIDGETEVVINPTISWNNQNDATGFRISLGTTPGGTNIVNNVDVGNSISYSPSGLLPTYTTVYATLTPYNNIGSAIGCTSTSFTTKGELNLSFCPNFARYNTPDPNRPPPPGGYGPNFDTPEATTLCTVSGCTPAAIPGFSLVGQLNDKAYYVSDGKERWLDAQTIAQSNGGDLATINDQATNDFLQAAIPAGENIAHIGINDEAVEGTLAWASGDAVSFTNFAPNEPSDSEIEDNGMLKLNGKWRLRKDTGKRRYFVELACGGACAGTPIAGYTYAGNEDNFDYYFSDEKETYANAQAFAAALGGSLATIRSQAANDLLVANNQGLKAYIGINDRVTEGTYVWDSGAPVTYENWANNYPDANAVEDFGAIRSATGLWAMNIEKNKYFFMEVDCVAGSGPGTVTITQTAGDPPDTFYPETVTDLVVPIEFTITDECGNTEICSFNLFVNQSPPSLVGQNTPTEMEQQKGATGVTPTGSISTQPKSSEVASLKNGNASIAVFPNPASDRFTIQLNNFNGEKQTLRIYDFTGKVVLEKRSNNQDARFEINTPLHSGIYSVVITSDEGELVTKQVIIK